MNNKINQLINKDNFSLEKLTNLYKKYGFSASKINYDYKKMLGLVLLKACRKYGFINPAIISTMLVRGKGIAKINACFYKGVLQSHYIIYIYDIENNEIKMITNCIKKYRITRLRDLLKIRYFNLKATGIYTDVINSGVDLDALIIDYATFDHSASKLFKNIKSSNQERIDKFINKIGLDKSLYNDYLNKSVVVH